MKKSFLRLFIALAGLWILIAAAVTVFFHAIGNPLDPTVVGILFAPGIGEFGFGALIKVAKEKSDAEEARAETEAAKAEAEALRAELEEARKPKPKAAKAAKGPDVGALRELLQTALDGWEG